MTTELFSKIHAMLPLFTKAERLVANFILSNPQDVLYMSITDLAEACKVGDTSVFRFCKKLKLQGYQEFKLALASNINLEGDTPQLLGEITQADTAFEVARKVLSTNLSALNETFALINPEDIKKVVELMTNAAKIFFFGVGASFITAAEARNKFMRIMPNVDCTFDSHLQTMTASLLKPKDIAIAISYSGSTKDTVDIAKICKKTGCKVVSITRFGKSPLASYSDVTLLCGANEGPLQGGSLSAKISQLYLLDVLYAEYFKQTFEISKHNKDITSLSVADKLY